MSCDVPIVETITSVTRAAEANKLENVSGETRTRMRCEPLWKTITTTSTRVMSVVRKYTTSPIAADTTRVENGGTYVRGYQQMLAPRRPQSMLLSPTRPR
jgi:hypothetical protein